MNFRNRLRKQSQDRIFLLKLGENTFPEKIKKVENAFNNLCDFLKLPKLKIPKK